MLTNNKAKYGISDSESNPILPIPQDYRSDSEKLQIKTYSEQLRDIDMKLDRHFNISIYIAYFNIFFFISLTISMILYILVKNKMPPVLFWLVFVLRNIILICTMFLIVKSKSERNSQYQKNIIEMLKLTLILCLIRWLFDLNTSTEYAIQWNPAINLLMNGTEFLLSTIGIVIFMYQTKLLKEILEVKETYG